jgi:similar to stage IV sporulation protein
VRARWNALVTGYVKIEVRGARAEDLINRIMDMHLLVWDIRRTAANVLVMHISIKDYFRLRPLLKQTGCRMHLMKRYGFPFFLNKLEQRKFFVAGFAGFIAGLYLLTSLVWQVHIEGNDKIAEVDVLSAARKQGVYPLQWKFKLADPDRISKGIIKQLPGTSWIGVEIQGTKVTIKVVESKQSEPKPLQNPRHIISTSDAVITQIIVEKGIPLVKKNQRIKKGDILISGILGDEENQKIVVAEGEVRGLVWHEYEISVPLIQKYKVYTGEIQERRYIVLGSRALQITGYGGDSFQKQVSDSKRNILKWRNYSLPIGWMKTKVMEVRHEERKLKASEARSLAIEQAKSDILIRSGLDAVVKAEKILHEKTESGKVYMKVLFEVEQLLGKELPIIQGE